MHIPSSDQNRACLALQEGQHGAVENPFCHLESSISNRLRQTRASWYPDGMSRSAHTIGPLVATLIVACLVVPALSMGQGQKSRAKATQTQKRSAETSVTGPVATGFKQLTDAHFLVTTTRSIPAQSAEEKKPLLDNGFALKGNAYERSVLRGVIWKVSQEGYEAVPGPTPVACRINFFEQYFFASTQVVTGALVRTDGSLVNQSISNYQVSSGYETVPLPWVHPGGAVSWVPFDRPVYETRTTVSNLAVAPLVGSRPFPLPSEIKKGSKLALLMELPDTDQNLQALGSVLNIIRRADDDVAVISLKSAVDLGPQIRGTLQVNLSTGTLDQLDASVALDSGELDGVKHGPWNFRVQARRVTASAYQAAGAAELSRFSGLNSASQPYHPFAAYHQILQVRTLSLGPDIQFTFLSGDQFVGKVSGRGIEGKWLVRGRQLLLTPVVPANTIPLYFDTKLGTVSSITPDPDLDLLLIGFGKKREGFQLRPERKIVKGEKLLLFRSTASWAEIPSVYTEDDVFLVGPLNGTSSVKLSPGEGYIGLSEHGSVSAIGKYPDPGGVTEREISAVGLQFVLVAKEETIETLNVRHAEHLDLGQPIEPKPASFDSVADLLWRQILRTSFSQFRRDPFNPYGPAYGGVFDDLDRVGGRQVRYTGTWITDGKSFTYRFSDGTTTKVPIERRVVWGTESLTFRLPWGTQDERSYMIITGARGDRPYLP